MFCDNDTKYGQLFDALAQTCGLFVIHNPYEAPRSNVVCERWVGCLRRECLDHVLIFDDRQLTRVLKEYLGYFDQARPHQGLAQQTPMSRWLDYVNVTPEQPATESFTPLALGRGAGRKLIARLVLNDLRHAHAWAT